jgi:hypothetical protein
VGFPLRLTRPARLRRNAEVRTRSQIPRADAPSGSRLRCSVSLRDTTLELWVEQGLQAARRGTAEADQDRLASRGAERADRGVARDLAPEAIGHDQPGVGREQVPWKIARHREVEATPPVPRYLSPSRLA